jgi:hypothetical protein
MYNFVALFGLLLVGAAPEESPSGEAIIRDQAGTTELVIRTTSRVAGAIHSVTWGGKEFIDSADHGRQLQSASNFDCNGRFEPEAFNPTEAGSRADHVGEKTSSKLLRLAVDGPELRTTTQMAFWLAPGEKSGGNAACNDCILSDHTLTKRVRIGHRGNPNVIEYDVTFTVPQNERHTYAQFEALTAYMPAAFSRFLRYEHSTKALTPLDDGPGEQAFPVVMATPSGSHAMGVYSPEFSPGYGRFRFHDDGVNKWNCVFRVRDPNGIKPGKYRYRMFVVVGALDDVRRALGSLRGESE